MSREHRISKEHFLRGPDDSTMKHKSYRVTTKMKYKYNEDKYIAEALEYISSTYGEHYVGEDQSKTQVVDLWESLGSLDTTARDTGIKYLARYGRKGGHNKKDLMKAIHYTILLWHATADKE